MEWFTLAAILILVGLTAGIYNNTQSLSASTRELLQELRRQKGDPE